MTDQEFLELLNEVAKKAKPFNNELTFIDSMDTPLNETSLDSLDILTCAIHLCEIYDVEEEQSKEMSGETPRDFLTFLKNGVVNNQVFLEQIKMIKTHGAKTNLITWGFNYAACR